MRRVAVVVCALAAALSFVVPAASASADVTMKNTTFNPSSVTINAGDTVTWHNQDGYAHTVTADDRSFDSGNVAGTVGTYSHSFNQPGTYPYHCEIHSGMTGTVVVQGGPPATQPPGPAPAPTPPPAATTPAARATTTSRVSTTTSTTSSTTTTVAPPAAADAGTTSSTTAAAGGGVALPAQKTSTGGDSVSPWLVALALVLVLGAGTGGVLVRRRVI